MREISDSILIAASENVGGKIREIISENEFELVGICTTGNEAIRRAQEVLPSLVIVSYKLPDMMGSQVAENLGSFCSIILLASESQKNWLGSIDDDCFVMTYPINKTAFLQAIDIMLRMQNRIGSLTRRIHELTHSIEDEQIIERAKDHLSRFYACDEYESHKRLQKMSMDSGKRIAEVARVILEHV